MRPVRLELRGFTAFRNETVVDFEGRHLFAITGPTGAGKSSLLDAITWALYGRVPRVGVQTNQLLSLGATVMAVRFDFRARGETYRVSRQRGKTMAARFERQVAPDQWHLLADRATEVGNEVERAIGLDYETFTKTVLLPQGAFDAFLRGDPGQRRDILSGLLGLSVYEQMRESAQARVVGARNRAEEQRAQADRLADATPEAIAAIDEQRQTIAARMTTVRQQRERLSALVTLEREASERTRDAATAQQATSNAAHAETTARETLAAAEQALESATQALARIGTERTTLAYDAERHAALQQQAEQLVQRANARADVERLEAALGLAQQACEQARGAAEAASATAKQARAALTKTIKARDTARTGLASSAGVALATVALLREAQAHLDGERVAAQRCAGEAEQRVLLIEALTKQSSEVRAELEGADSEVQRTTAAAAQAEAERVASDAAQAAASTRRDEAVAGRALAGRESAAADLRRGLAIGDPCPVCGEPLTSLAEHNAPDLDAADAAVREAEAVLHAARAARETRMQAATAAQAHLEAARVRLANVQGRLDAVEAECASAGVALAEIGTAHAHAAVQVSTARTAVAEVMQRLTSNGERERGLALLLASVPSEVQAEAGAEADDGKKLEATLQAAIAKHAGAASTASEAERAASAADEAARAATTEATHAEERATSAATAVGDARARLEALGASDGADGEALLAALGAAEAQAKRDAELDQEARTAESARAGEASRLDERRSALVAASADVALRVAASNVAAEATSVAAEAYAVQWRTMRDVTSAPDAEQLALWGERVGRDEVQVATEHALTEQRLEQARAHAVEAEQLRVEAAAHERTFAVAQGLEQDLRRNNFIAYVQREAMQVLASEAAERMEHLSRGRYRMRADGDEFVVIDRLNGDEQRSVKTLSGGETFLASLALALALAERLPSLAGHGSAISLESLFLDEGFGTLDADALDVAIEALELLAGDNRMIGVISHVPLIAERLPDRIEVMRVGGSSTVR